MAGIESLPVEIFWIIFSHLDFLDLLNVADSTIFLREMVLSYPELKFDNTMVVLTNFGKGKQLILSPSFPRRNSVIYINNLEVILNSLRLFGSLFKHLELSDYDALSKEIIPIYRHINKYCINLVRMDLCYLNFDINRAFIRKFKSVRMVVFVTSVIGWRLCQLSHWFPNLTELAFLYENSIRNPNAVMKKYPNLEKLTIYESSIPAKSSGDLQYSERFEYLNSLSRLNPLLLIHCHGIGGDYDFKNGNCSFDNSIFY